MKLLAFAAFAAFLVLGAAAAEVKEESVIDALKKLGATKYLEIIDAANATAVLAEQPASKTTVFAPSNKAVDAYLKENQMGTDDLKRRQALADRIVGYTIVADGDKDIVSEVKPGETKFLPTYNPGWAITAKRGKDGKLTLIDAGGDDATVDDKKSKNGLVFLVDELLLPGNIFERWNDYRFDVLLPNMTVVKQQQFDTVKALFQRSGLDRSKSKDLTFFAPNDEAFKAAGIDAACAAKMTPGEAEAIIRYHTVKGYQPIPNIKAGEPMETMLKVKDAPSHLKLDYVVNKTDAGAVGTAYVIDEAGNKAEVLAPNWFAGTMTVHAINKVLSRKGAEVPSACKAAGPVPAKADKAAKPAKAEKPAKGNRRLQQYIGAGTASIIAMNNAKGAIQNAVDDANPAATFAATSAGQLNARATAFPTTRTFLYSGMYNQYGLSSSGYY
ncbi:hypothetical protein Rsub_03044 [Raphidocelis subcapitata]|uniref:FAS1 domain-containing protein n=1 Tax=Raphidocelis subcapitata TaxID=307507 RepID=A0A2V0NYT9_9CHLO|nr:hypothetical protein Rsub_03044 [Raphidocelis subcapitata]|eukprot:GBF90743.1 hypothetical protein Rsub_03044 [Raphidocelis subcapitata]